MVDTLNYLKKGGRITPAAAALGTLLKLKPVLQIQGEKLDAFAKARTVKQAKSIMIDAMKSDFEKRFNNPDGSQINLEMAYTHDIAAAGGTGGDSCGADKQLCGYVPHEGRADR